MTPDHTALYLGVDAGNSKTVAVVSDSDGFVRGHGRGASGDIYSAPGEARAVEEVLRAVSGAVEMASARLGRPVGPGDLRHAAFCLAGLDWASDEQFWHHQVSTRVPELVSYSLHNDGFALLRAGQPSGVGVAVSVGTGGAVVARGPGGQEWSASFWIVDPLGGGALGSRGCAAVVRAELGIGAPTALRELVLSRHGFSSVENMLEASTRREVQHSGYARFARDVLDAAAAGDEVAGAVVTDQADALAAYAKAAARRVRLPGSDFAVVLGGSVLASVNPVLRDAATRALERLLPGASVLLTPRSPVVGAVAEAIAEAAGPLPGAVVDRLTRSEFPAEFLLT